jgi:hypothetical protein
MPEERFPLADLIGALGRELREAQRRATLDDEAEILRLRDCTIEMGVTWEKKADGGVDFWVVKLGAGVTKENTQTMTVSLEPVGETVVEE